MKFQKIDMINFNNFINKYIFICVLILIFSHSAKSDPSDYFNMDALSEAQKINQNIKEYIVSLAFMYAPNEDVIEWSFLHRCKDSGNYMQIAACIYRKEVSLAAEYNIFNDYPDQLEIVNRRKNWIHVDAERAHICGYTEKCVNQLTDNIYDIAADTINEQSYSFIRANE